MQLGEMLVMGFEWYIVFLFSTVCHEAAHALAALKLGDRTAYYGGQVSLDPVPHVRREPIGMIVVPLLSFFLNNGQWMMGWASAPYDPFWAARYPRRAALMALAGPVSNLLLVLVAGLLIRGGMLFGSFVAPPSINYTTITSAPAGGFLPGVAVLISILFTLNLALFVFNLLPMPPLDGSALPPLFLEHAVALKYLELVRSPGLSLIGLVVAWKLFPLLFSPIHLLAINLLYPGMHYH